MIPIPSHNELYVILNRREYLSKYHHKLYRKFKDLIGIYSSPQQLDIVKKHFTRWASSYVGVSKFNALLYCNYLIFKFDQESSTWNKITSFMIENEYIDTDKSKRFTTDKFNTKTESIKWLMSYRWTKSLYKGKLNNIDDLND